MATAISSLPPPRWTVAPFETGAQIVARLADIYAPRLKITGTEWARRNTNYDLDALPWHPEVLDALTDPETAEVGLMGPSQAGKSTIGLCWFGYIIDCDPADTMLCQPSQALTQTFVVTRLQPFVDATPAVKTKLLALPSADNIFLKQYQGMFLASVWPVAAQFAQRPIRFGWLDDYDQIPADIEGQGSAVKLLTGRQTTFEGRDTKFVSSSPADDGGGGIQAFVESGTDERLQPECPSCGERWEPDLLRDLRFEGSTSDDAERTAHVVCPNGCVLGPEHRRPLIDSLARLPHRGFVAARPEASRRRRTFRVDGLLAFTSWSTLAREWRDAQIAWELRQDESELRTFVNTKAAKNYRSQLSGEAPLKTTDLAARREPGFAIGTVPAGVKVIVIVVDAQHGGFECAAIGWGDKLESWLIDRWSIEAYADGVPMRPFTDGRERVAEALLPLWRKTWPLADGSGQSPPPLSVAIDTGGGGTKEDSWTATVQALWHKATAPLSRDGWGIERKRITLLKGGSNPRAPRLMPPAQFADRKIAGGAKRRSPDLWMPNVHRIKNMIDVRLRIGRPGPGYIHLPGADRPGSAKRERGDPVRGIEDHHLDEITAEELKKGRWEKLRARNETWDHLVYAYASILKPPFAQSRDHMRWVPAPFRVPDQAALIAVAVERGTNDPAIGTVADDVRATPARPGHDPRPAAPARPAGWIDRKKTSNWLNRRR